MKKLAKAVYYSIKLNDKSSVNFTKKAKQKVSEAKSEIQRQAEEKEDNMDDLIDQVAKLILEENEPYIGTEVKDKAIEKLEETKEGGKANGKKTRGRKKSTTV